MVTTSVSDPLSVVTELAEAFARGDLAGVAATLSEDVVWDVRGVRMLESAPVFEGKDSVVADMLALVGELFEPSTFNIDVEDTIASGDKVVVQWRVSAMTRSGRKYHNSYCMIFTVRDSRVTRVDEYLDSGYFSAVLFGME